MKKLIVMVGLALLLVCAAPAQAQLIPLLDRLDIQLGPGLAVVDTSPFLIEVVGLATAKVYERAHFEARVGGLFDDEREALVLGVTRNFNDLITRTVTLNDGREVMKPLLPSVGLWVGFDLVSTEVDGEEKKAIDFLFGLNAVMAEW